MTGCGVCRFKDTSISDWPCSLCQVNGVVVYSQWQSIYNYSHSVMLSGDHFLSLGEAVKYLQVPHTTLRLWLAVLKIPRRRVGVSSYFAESGLRNLELLHAKMAEGCSLSISVAEINQYDAVIQEQGSVPVSRCVSQSKMEDHLL